MNESQTIIDKVAWIFIRDKKILSTLSIGKSKYYIPGGKREKEETDSQTLIREIKEELSVSIIPSSINYFGIFKAQADSHPNGVIVQMTCYTAHYKGKLQPSSEIEKYVWLAYQDKSKVSEVDAIIFDFLYDKKLLT